MSWVLSLLMFFGLYFIFLNGYTFYEKSVSVLCAQKNVLCKLEHWQCSDCSFLWSEILILTYSQYVQDSHMQNRLIFINIRGFVHYNNNVLPAIFKPFCRPEYDDSGRHDLLIKHNIVHSFVTRHSIQTFLHWFLVVFSCQPLGNSSYFMTMISSSVVV